MAEERRKLALEMEAAIAAFLAKYRVVMWKDDVRALNAAMTVARRYS